MACSVVTVVEGWTTPHVSLPSHLSAPPGRSSVGTLDFHHPFSSRFTHLKVGNQNLRLHRPPGCYNGDRPAKRVRSSGQYFNSSWARKKSSSGNLRLGKGGWDRFVLSRTTDAERKMLKRMDHTGNEKNLVPQPEEGHSRTRGIARDRLQNDVFHMACSRILVTKL